MMTWQQKQDKIEEQVSLFRDEFGLRAFPGERFRLSKRDSYVNDAGMVMLYTQIHKDGKWLSFAKGSAMELRREVTL